MATPMPAPSTPRFSRTHVAPTVAPVRSIVPCTGRSSLTVRTPARPASALRAAFGMSATCPRSDKRRPGVPWSERIRPSDDEPSTVSMMTREVPRAARARARNTESSLSCPDVSTHTGATTAPACSAATAGTAVAARSAIRRSVRRAISQGVRNSTEQVRARKPCAESSGQPCWPYTAVCSTYYRPVGDCPSFVP